jgi:SAM-dependent methyltransferase
MFAWRRILGRARPRDTATAIALLGDWLEPRHERFGHAPYLLGHCLVCGKASAFFCADVSLARETLNCAECGSTSRYRSIAAGVLRAIEELGGRRCSSIAAVSEARLDRKLEIYDTQVPFSYATVSYPIPRLLAQCPDLEVVTSMYKPERPLGERLGEACTNQDLERLTFEPSSFDVVITSDVMEHVRLASRAHREIRRVLRTGGVYLFTVPHFRHGDTVELVRIHDPDDPARDEIVGEPQYHGDANSESGRVLAYRAFGLDLDRELEGLGFTVAYDRTDRPQLGLLNTELFYCRAVREPGA